MTAVASGAARTGTLGSRGRRKQTWIAWGFAAPFMVLFVVFMAGPIVMSLLMSFTDFRTRDLRTPFNVNFIGIENYAGLFADPRFVHSLLNTGVFVLVGVPLTMFIALLVAVALNSG